MIRITFEIPADQVLTSNRLPRNRHALDAKKRRLRALADAQLRDAPTSPAPVRAVWMVRYGKGTTPKADPSNCQPTFKILLDAAVDAGVIPDDAPAYVRSETSMRVPNLDVRGLYWITLHLIPTCPTSSALWGLGPANTA